VFVSVLGLGDWLVFEIFLSSGGGKERLSSEEPSYIFWLKFS
jgi:hypothetical protein